MILIFAFHRMIKIQITFSLIFFDQPFRKESSAVSFSHSIIRIASLNNTKVLNECNVFMASAWWLVCRGQPQQTEWETSSAVALQGAELRPSDDVTRFGQATWHRPPGLGNHPRCTYSI